MPGVKRAFAWLVKKRWYIRLAVVVLFVGYLKLVGLDGKFYYPDAEVYSVPADFGLTHEEVRFTTADGLRLAGWFLPAQGDPKGLIIHFHGNAANVSAHVGLVAWLPAYGYRVLMFDYRGYGQSEGRVTRAGTIRDATAAIAYALTRPEAADLPLFAYGQSLGGAVAIAATADRPEVDAVVAESTFGSYRGIAAMHVRSLVRVGWLSNFLSWLCVSSGYDPIDSIQRIAPRPVLIIAAEDDRICFPALAQELFDAASEPKSFWMAPGAEHLGIYATNNRELSRRLTEFFDHAAQNTDKRKKHP